AVVCYILTAAFSYIYLSYTASLLLTASAFLALAYSIFFKRIFLLGNLIAAGLSMTPGLIMFLDVRLHTPEPWTSAGEISIAFLVIGFLFLVSREIKFDEFDQLGDRIGRRLTLPMIFSRTVLNMMHTVLTSSALSLLLVTIAMQGTYPLSVNL